MLRFVALSRIADKCGQHVAEIRVNVDLVTKQFVYKHWIVVGAFVKHEMLAEKQHFN